MTIIINDKEYQPVFNMGTMRRIGELTKKDPFTLNIDYTKPDEIYRYVFLIVQAGLQSAKVPVTAQQVQEVVDNWDLQTAMEAIMEFNKAFVVEPKPGEDVSAQ